MYLLYRHTKKKKNDFLLVLKTSKHDYMFLDNCHGKHVAMAIWQSLLGSIATWPVSFYLGVRFCVTRIAVVYPPVTSKQDVFYIIVRRVFKICLLSDQMKTKWKSLVSLYFCQAIIKYSNFSNTYWCQLKNTIYF